MALNVGFIANPQLPKIDIVDPLEQQSKQIQLRQLLRQEQDESAQRDALTQSGGDSSKYLQALASGGNYKAYQAAQKAALEGRKEEADITYKGAQTGKLLTEREEMGIKSHRDSLAGVNDPQTAAAWLQSGYSDPVIGKRMASLAPLEQAISRIPQDPAGFQQWKQQAALGATKYIEVNKPSYQTRNLGGTTDTLALPGLGGPAQTVSSMRNTATPGDLLQAATSRRGQDLKFQTDIGANAAVVGKKIQDVELKLQDDYRQESKGFSETSTSMKKILGAIDTADKNPGSALAAGTAFMKILDPNSVVRETELGMALNASGWFDRATNIANTLRSGRVMTSEQKKNLKSASEALFEEAKAAQLEVDAAYRKRAIDYGASPDRVIVDRGQNAKRPGSVSPAGGIPAMSDIDAEIARRRGKK